MFLIFSEYVDIHGFLCVGICAFGIVANLLHIKVLTTGRMRKTAVNSILTAIAICDTGLMIDYVIYIYHYIFGVRPVCSHYKPPFYQFRLASNSTRATCNQCTHTIGLYTYCFMSSSQSHYTRPVYGWLSCWRSCVRWPYGKFTINMFHLHNKWNTEPDEWHPSGINPVPHGY
jgi:hypothetical protein